MQNKVHKNLKERSFKTSWVILCLEVRESRSLYFIFICCFLNFFPIDLLNFLTDLIDSWIGTLT